MKNIVYIGVDKLHPHPDNPRKDLGDLSELSASIQAKGVLQNLTVVEAGEDTYRIIIGHRRHAAAKLAGLKVLPCVIADMTPQEQFETMMVENVHRSDLTVYEQAEGFQMMLDMGGSVEQVAQKTGFSETTIRRRVKLLELDKKKFVAATARGGTMQDYLDLQSIKDPKTRDRVLDTVGTSNFTNALKSAVDNETSMRVFEELLTAIKNAGWCEEIEPSAVRNHGAYEYIRCIYRYNPDTTPPEDVGTAKYVYYTNDSKYIYLYKEKLKTAAEDIAKEKKKRLDAELNEIVKELDEISDRHLEMRENFILEFNSFNSSEMDIAAFAAKAMLYAHDNGSSIDVDRLGNMLNVPVSEEEELDPKAWNHALFHNPQAVLLCTAYAMLEGSGRKYNGLKRNSNIGINMPIPRDHHMDLDLIYSGLKSLGYELSDEEKQMQNGTHPLFQRAKFLVDAYLQEKKEAENG